MHPLPMPLNSAHDTLADALRSNDSASKGGEHEAPIRPCSKVIAQFLVVRMKHGYIEGFETTDVHKAGEVVVNRMSWSDQPQV